MCVELYWWSIELEGIFVLPLAPRWVRHSYLSKEATIDPLYLWVIMEERWRLDEQEPVDEQSQVRLEEVDGG